MKAKLFITLLSLSLLFPVFSSAQLITTSQTTTTTKKIEKVKKPRTILPPVARGFEHSVEFTNKFFDDPYYSGGLDYILGYRFSNYFFLGAGLGLNFHDEYGDHKYRDGGYKYSYDIPVGIPLYLHARIYFTKTRCQPFLSLSTGVYFCSPCSYFINPMVGVNYRITSTVGMYLTVGYSGNTKRRAYYYSSNWNNNLEISLGCTFSSSDVKKVINEAKNLISQ